MSTPMIAGRTLGLVSVSARLDPVGGTRGITIPSRRDPDHRIAWSEVRDQRSDYAEVTYPDGVALAFRAWRVGPTSWAWQTPSMGAPAFAGYTLPENMPAALPSFYGMAGEEWAAYGAGPRVRTPRAAV